MSVASPPERRDGVGAREIKQQFSIDWLDYHGRYDADQLAAVDLASGRRFSYGEFNRRLRRLAAGLQRHFGIRKGDRVAVIAENSTDLFEMLFACWAIGAALMPLNWRLTAREVRAILANGEPSLVIVDEAFAPLLRGTTLPLLMRQEEVAPSDYEALISQSDENFRAADLTIDDLGTLLYTSGTTGRPKGVIGTFRMMRDTIIHHALHGELTGSSRSLTCAPLFHAAGLYGFSMPVFHYGGTLYVMRQWDPKQFLDLVTDPKVGITHTVGVPAQYAMVAELPEFRRAEFPALRVAAVGGAPITQELLENWAARGVHLSQTYGLTEAFSVAILPPQQAREKIGSVGHRMMHTRLKIADDRGRLVQPGEVGEIMVRGPAVTPGYWRNPEETEKAFLDGWLRTGDAGVIREDGTVFIVDRYKDMFISGGENVYPAEIENVLTDMPEIYAAAVIGVADPKWGQVGLAAIQLRAGADLDEERVRAFCAERLARYKLPRHLHFVDRLPFNAQGKVRKDVLRRHFATNGAPAED
ncbi:MAG: AMP-binding protein [Gammaproteobacteria bacterium]